MMSPDDPMEQNDPRAGDSPPKNPASNGDQNEIGRHGEGNGERSAIAEIPAGADNSTGGASSNSDELRELIVDTLKTVYDPEIPVNIYELGMIYDIELQPGGRAVVTMTLTSPSCPVAGSLPLEVEDKLRGLPGLEDVRVDLVWDPPWTPEKISEAAKLELGIF